jgi:NADH:ubiquinone oxidoreductase subunit F (NADH-binding)
MTGIALLVGPPLASGAETHIAHVSRLGPLPPASAHLVTEIETSGLRGRGGAAFPVATKWRSVAGRAQHRAVVLANGAEGEPLSQKDRVLMERRPHLVLDGAVLAAHAVGANRVVLYVGAEHIAAAASLQNALRERAGSDRIDIDMVTAPPRYVAGEESAAVHCVNDGIALPTAVPPRPYERGIDGRPTLVQNVETLAHTALIARHGGRWFADLGVGTSTGTTLLTVSGDVHSAGVIEVAAGTPLSDVLVAHATVPSHGSAILLGGFFGGWVGGDAASALDVDAMRLRGAGHSLGCGIVHVRGPSTCGVEQTARIVDYLADQSARQCGPCVFGLRAISGALASIAVRQGTPEELMRVRRWSGELAGRGGCRHPDGAANLVRSALDVFADEFAMHVQRRRCSAPERVERAA